LWAAHNNIKVDGQVISEQRFLALQEGDLVTLVEDEAPRMVYFGFVNDDSLLLSTRLPTLEADIGSKNCLIMTRRVTWCRKASKKALRQGYEREHGEHTWMRELPNACVEVENIKNRGGE
jgi:hypothetical protein